MARGLFDALPGRSQLRYALIAELDQIVPGQTSLVDLTAILGKPSFEGAFDSGKVYYLSEVMVEPPGGRKRASTRTLIVISLDDDIVRDIEVRDESTGKTIAYLDERSPTPGDTFGVTEQIFSTLRRKPR